MSRPFLLPRLMMDYGTLKPGLYFYANEVLDRLLLFGGVSFNFLRDSDLFLLFEFRKFRPTLYAEFFTARRNVREEFEWYDYPGTNDLRFTFLEGTVGGRWPAGFHRFWLELAHSRYRERIRQELNGVFILPFDYYVGTHLVARWRFANQRPEYGGNMFPTRGFHMDTELRVERNGLISGFAINEDFGTFGPVLEPNHTLRVTVDITKHQVIHRPSRLAATYRASLGWLSQPQVDDFFYFFGGGLPGLRGYTFYDSTAQGSNLMIHTLAIRKPIILERNIPLGPLTLQNISLGLIGQWGDGFSGSWLQHSYKTSAGLELRLNGINFYVMPFALSYEVHRPLGPDFGGEYRHYLSLLFDF